MDIDIKLNLVLFLTLLCLLLTELYSELLVLTRMLLECF